MKKLPVQDGFYAVHLARSNDMCDSPIGCWAFGIQPRDGAQITWLSQSAIIDLQEMIEQALETVAEREEVN